MSKPLTGKIALITGASRGIGRAIAEALAADGALVAVHYGKNKSSADDVVAGIKKAGGDAFAVGADLAKPSAAQTLFTAFDTELKAKTGDVKFDILVNNAGVAPFVGFADTTEAAFDELYTINVKSLFFITQQAAKRLRDGGRIISLSSVVARAPVAALPAYSMLKAPLDNLTKSLAVELGARAITVNAIAPGVIETDMSDPLISGSGEAGVTANQALKRIGKPGDIAALAQFLAGDDSRWVTGQTIEASGGAGVTLG